MNNTNNKTRLFLGDNIELLRQLPDNSVDSIVTDAPYGLGQEPNPTEVMQSWITNGYHEISGKGFMGKEWDAFVPQPLFWKEAYRVLKHGGHVVCFFGTRTYDWGVMAMRFAGFEVRDCIQWLYGSGFPKSHNISKAIDKMQGCYIEGKESVNSRNGVQGDEYGYNHSKKITLPNPQSEEAKQWDGWGSALKPANEPIVLARKPLEKGLSIAENVLKWGVGGINIDGSRIGNGAKKWENPRGGIWSTDIDAKAELIDNPQGRFPANLILTHHPDCECVGIKKVGSGKEGGYNYEGNVYEVEGFIGNNSPNANSNYGIETIENWICVDNCPVKILDEQSGVLKSGKMTPEHNRSTNGSPNGIYGKFDVNHPLAETYGYTGGASRFFMNFDSGGNDSFFYYIYEEINTKICGNILENQKVVGMLNGVMLEAEKYIQSVEQFTFGNKSMENYQMDAKYTISTLTKQMIELKTCNALQGLNIDFYTEELLKTINSLTILSIEDVNFANCINRFKNLLLELVEHIKGIVNHVKSPYYKNGEKTIEKNTTHTIENIGKDQKHRFFYTAKASKDDRNEGLKKEKWFYDLELVTEFCSFTEEYLFIWEQEAQNQNMGLNGEVQQKRDISEVIALLAKDSECCTTLNGKNITAVFPSAIKFTTKTGLKQIIELKTLNFYQPLSINDCIVDVLEMNKANGSNLAENVGIKNLLKLIFTKDEMGFPLGVKIAVKKTPLSISVKEKWHKTNIHSTVKPTELMRYLCRLITPPNGIVLDPFMGSGSTGKAAILEGFQFVGMEMEEEYFKIAEARIAKAERDYFDSKRQLNLF